MSEPKTNVPKFASFRPKPAPPSPDAGEDNDRERKHSSKPKYEPRDRDDRQQRHRHHRSRSKEEVREKSSSHKIERKPSRAHTLDEAPEIFVVDRNGDLKNLVYGSIHRYSVPAFHRFGAGLVLGAPPDFKIDRDYGDEEGIVLSNSRDFKNKFREKYVFSKIAKERPQLLKIRPEVITEDQTALQANFVPLQTSKGKTRKRGVEGEEFSDSDGGDRDYRSIYGNAKSKDHPVDADLQYATESDSSGSETGRTVRFDAAVRQKNIELSRKVEKFPHDIEAWLALIEHQDTLLRSGDDRRRVTNAEMRSTADIKIHMYEKALANVKSLKDRERLMLGLMNEGAKVWDVKAQSRRWEQVSKDNIDSLLLWTSYLNFKQSSFSTFRFEELKEVFVKRIKLLLEAISALGIDNADALYNQLIYVILRFTLFLGESGYSELSVSIWQGLLEMNFFCPAQLLSSTERIGPLRDFWESEVPRIGEDGALGWEHFLQSEELVDAPEPSIDQTDNYLNNEDLFKSWSTAEHLRSELSRIPARTMDEVAEDDPFRVILFSDIEDFMISLPPQSGPLHRSCLDAFLLFCRLPPMTSLERDDSRWHTDAFIRGELLEYNPEFIKREYLPRKQNENEEAAAQSPLQMAMQLFSASPESLFGVNNYFQNKSWEDHYAGNTNGPLSYRWIRNTLRQLTEKHFRDDLAEYYMAFEFLNERDTIKKISKGLLKRYPTSLRLYNSYAIIEWSRGNRDIARSVFAAALNLRSSMPEADWTNYSIILWKSWTWANLEDLDNSTALQTLLSIAAGAPDQSIATSPAIILKSKQHLASNRDYLLSTGNLSYSILYAECLALLEYLSSKSGRETKSSAQGDISSALTAYSSFSQTLIDRNLTQTSSHELFLQSAARLLRHHARIGPFRPVLIREHLTKFLHLFPQNTIFLTLYSWNESRVRIDNRVRNILLSTLLTPENDTLTSRLFAIQYEINYGTIHSTRSAFEHALSPPALKSSAGLWRFYIIYCLETPQFRAQVKEIWYRALRACPWAKELYLIGFEKLSRIIDFTELRSTWKIMGEKGLRVHVDLEDQFEEVAELEKRGHE